MQKERESNFELLRILAMVLIITYHYCLHGNGGTIFSGEICGNQIISVLFGSWGIVGVFLFVFISAYFLIDSKHYKIEKVILIALSTSFYAVLILCIMKMSKTADFELKYILKSFLCPLTDQYWFIPSYIMLFLFYPFLNKFIKSVSRTTLLYLVLLLTMTIPLYRSIIKVAPVHLFSLFIYLYLLMGYLKGSSNNFFERNAKRGFCITISLSVLTYILWLVVEQHIHLGIYYDLYRVFFINRFSPISILIAIFLFYIFKNMKIPNSKLINNIAKSTLGIYLIHENPSLYYVLWNKWLHVNVAYYKPIYLLHMLLSVILIFIVCYMIDWFRLNILERYVVIPLMKQSKLIKKINIIYNEQIMRTTVPKDSITITE